MNQMAQFQKLLDEMKREAYDQGWRDAIAHILSAAKGTERPAPASPVRVQLKTYGRGDVIDFVLKFVSTHNGVRTNEVIEGVKQEFPGADPTAAERTIRTSLGRLKRRDKKIVKRNGRWYPVL